MPIYVFLCPECGAVLERLQGVEAPAPGCCGRTMGKKPAVFSGGLAPHLRADAESVNAKARAFFERPETKEKLDKGELARGIPE